MRTTAWRRPALVVAGLAAASAMSVASAMSAGSAAAGTGQPRDGSASAAVEAISCPSAGNCAAVGSMQPPGQNLTFVVNSRHGHWGRVQRVRGLNKLPNGGAVQGDLDTVSCPSAGNCAAGGSYVGRRGDADEAFVVSERDGRWGNAEQVPGIRALKDASGGLATVDSLSCSAPGDCSAAGDYSGTRNGMRLFVVDEKNGRWSRAIVIPGSAALTGGLKNAVSHVRDLSCGAPGDCAVGGFYESRKGTGAFIATERNGVWDQARQVPGTAGGSDAVVAAISCPSAGTCTAIGGYFSAKPGFHLVTFAISEKNDRWGRARTIGDAGDLQLISCTSAGDCVAASGLLVTEKNGVWGKAERIPGAVALAGKAGIVGADALSCTSAGNCSAGGSYSVGNSLVFQAFVINERNGIWGKAEEVPGSAALNRGGGADVFSVSCGGPGNCAAGGDFTLKSGRSDPYLVTERHGIWGKAEEVPGLR